MAKDKKQEQLGMPIGTAAHRLRKSLLWKYAQKCGDTTCFQCGKPIETIDEFTVEHKVPWLDSDDPVGLFFDLDNIAFSHHSCNVAAKRVRRRAVCGEMSGYRSGCRCAECRKANTERAARTNTPERRRARRKAQKNSS